MVTSFFEACDLGDLQFVWVRLVQHHFQKNRVRVSRTALPAYTVSTVKYAVDLLWHFAFGEAEAAPREEEAARAESKAAVHTGALSCVFVFVASISIKPACTERGDS